MITLILWVAAVSIVLTGIVWLYDLVEPFLLRTQRLQMGKLGLGVEHGQAGGVLQSTHCRRARDFVPSLYSRHVR